MPRVELTEQQLKRLEALLGEPLTMVEEPLTDPFQLAAKHSLGPSTRANPCQQCSKVHAASENPLHCRCYQCGQVGEMSVMRLASVSQGATAGALCIQCAMRQKAVAWGAEVAQLFGAKDETKEKLPWES